MAFILDQQRDADCALAFDLYRKYLQASKRDFPDSAFELASSDWWYDFNDRRCPHDGRIISVEMRELETPDGMSVPSLTVLLAGAWGSERHRITYNGILEYDLDAETPSLMNGHGDWRYDEFRVDGGGNVIHEIEWGNGARWLIKCRDIEHAYIDKSSEKGVADQRPAAVESKPK